MSEDSLILSFLILNSCSKETRKKYTRLLSLMGLNKLHTVFYANKTLILSGSSSSVAGKRLQILGFFF